MYVHIGDEVVVPARELVAILDARLLQGSEANQAFFAREASAGRIRGHHWGGARSVVLTTRGVYPSPISPRTLARRVLAASGPSGANPLPEPTRAG
jgi:hypothetical protein